MTSEKKVLNWRWTLMIGFILLLIGAYIMKMRIDYYNTSVGVVGVITEIQERDGSKSKKTYYPVVEYQTETGEVLSTEGDVGSSSAYDYDMGEPINVRYLISNPKMARLSTFRQMWLLPVVLLVLGGLFIAMAIYNYKNPPVPKS